MNFNNTPQQKNSKTDASNPSEESNTHTIESFIDTGDTKATSKKRLILFIATGILTIGALGLFAAQIINNTQESPPEKVMPEPSEKPPEEKTSRPAVSAPTNRAYVDATDERIHTELSTFAQWLADNKSYGIIGEFGWPNDLSDGGEQWRTIAEQYFIDLAQTNLTGYYWATGGAWGDYDLSVHNAEDGIITSVNSQSFQLNAFSKDNALGINMAGLEFGTQAEGFSNKQPGSIAEKSYIINDKANYAYIAEEGYETVRIPFSWERLQPELKGPLDATYLGYILTSIEHATAADMHVVLDLHNYGAYTDSERGVMTLGSELTHEDLVDVWIKLSSALENTSGDISYGIMNEPHGLLAGQWSSPAENWEVASQLVVTSLRDADDEREIIVGGYHWSKLSTWMQYHDDAWIKDPQENTIYEAHHYWDSDTSGIYENGYE